MSEASPPTEATKTDKKHKFVQYEHHGEVVTVREDLKGKHRNVCLCFACDKFCPDEPHKCKIAHALYGFAVANRVVVPVWECAEFKELGSKPATVTGVSGDAKVM